jgi:hypothetical protein
MSLIPLATVKQFLRIAHTAEDTALQIILDSAESWVAKQAGVHLTADGATEHTTVTEDLDGDGAYLWPTKLPVRTISTVKDVMDDLATVPATEYALGEFYTRIERWADTSAEGTLTEWSSGRKRYRVEYEAGYLASELPTAFKVAVLQYVYRDYHGRDAKSSALYDPSRDEQLRALISTFSLRRLIA